jgi:hypothetical protein
MAHVDGELDIRAALADLTDGQPPVPPGRLPAVRRKAASSRRRRLASAGGAGVAVVALAVALATVPRTAPQQPLTRHVPGWALPWPDHRSGSVPQSDLDYAVLSWRLTESGIVNTGLRTSPAQLVAYEKPYQVTWYLAQTIDRGRFVVVMFEARRLGKTQLVFGYAPARLLAGFRPSGIFVGRGPWVLAIARGPDPHTRHLAFGGTVNTGTSSHPDDWLVMVAAPGVRSISWQAFSAHGLRSGTTPAPSGIAVTNVGRLTGQVLLSGWPRGLLPLQIVPLSPG